MSFDDRYSRQILFKEIGAEGQHKLSRARVVIVGCGATGSVLASLLARAGVGVMRIIDRDYVEPSNLQRQSLFDEDDARDSVPKAIAAARQIARRTVINKGRRSRVRGAVRKVEEAIASGDRTAAVAAMAEAEPAIIRGAQKGVVHRNAARRKVSRLAHSIAKLGK